MIEDFQNIYAHMGDELSKTIYMDRLNYSITGEGRHLDGMVDRTVRSRKEWKAFCEGLKEKAQSCNMYLFGAGIWGSTLYKETKAFIPWRGVIDNQPEGKVIGRLDIVTLEQFTDWHDRDAVIVISSYKNSQSMLGQLKSAGISQDKIINGGEVIYSLTEGAIYFDLEELGPRKPWEIFVDGGGFDGLTTKEFFKWCEGKGYSYCFEFDNNNIAAIKNLFADNRDCCIVPKALWSESTVLSAQMKGNYASAVVQGAEEDDAGKVEAVALDDFLKDKPVTFIKMDIEGAESAAIKGAGHTITNQHPKLAVSIYHKAEDIQTIPQMILEYYPDYKFYLRHYSFSYYDTVLYAIEERDIQ